MQNLSLEVQGFLVSLVFNWRLQRRYQPNPSLPSRTPGFTEVWGTADNDNDNDDDDDNNDDERSQQWRAAQQFASTIEPPRKRTVLSSNNNDDDDDDIPLFVLQFRPAWAVQLVLRVAGLRYRVCNHAAAFSEAAGPLPHVGHSPRSSDWRRWASLVGQRQPPPPDNDDPGVENSLLDYLYRYHGVTLARRPSGESSSTITTPNGTVVSELYVLTQLLEETLPQCWTVLCYRDGLAWWLVHRPQSIRAYNYHDTGGSSSSIYAWIPGAALWQTWCERTVALLSLATTSTTTRPNMTTQRALQQMAEAYRVLESMLQSNAAKVSKETTTTSVRTNGCLMGSELTYYDLLLWDHLMNAIQNVHLVDLLATQHPTLLQYVDCIWDRYFGTISESWEQHNHTTNQQNAFCSNQSHSSTMPSAKQTYAHALDLMASLNPSQKTLQPSATITKRRTRPPSASSSDARRKVNEPERSDAESKQRRKTQQHQSADQVWLATVLMTTIASFTYVVISMPKTNS